MHELRSLVASLADRDKPRTEAIVQADVRQLLLQAPLGLDEGHVVLLEAPVDGRKRIDVEVGYTVIEVKKDLRTGRVRAEAEVQLAGYVSARTKEMGQRYVGVLTDGAEWHAYHPWDGHLVEVATLTVSPSQPDIDALLIWLEGVLATVQGLRPTPDEVARRLGAGSTSHALDRETLGGLYAAHGDLPSVKLKRHLWARLLTSALGTQFEDTDELFIEHTLLVNSAKLIANAVLGQDLASLPPASLLSGQRFERARIYGVVDEDFFDWMLEVPGGEAFVKALARRLARFDWAEVEHDVLKVLYESVIGTDTRRKLGEYYTPDWLAEQMVDAVVTEPLELRVLDPSCGSGTFLFHAVRRVLDAAEAAGIPLAEALARLTGLVLGVDLHPVAVAFARVTYVLAIGRRRLASPNRGSVTVPVYLGDSMQWHQRLDLLTAGHLVIPVEDDLEMVMSELRFPDHLLNDAGRFDHLVNELVQAASSSQRHGVTPTDVVRRLGIRPQDEATIAATFDVLRRLHAEGRDHIWGYYVRNLARPLWLSRPENRVDVLIGNPPWLAYRHMPADMQKSFRAMCESRSLWHGATVATNQDLSGLFVARTVQQYLRQGGRFAFVLPNAALDRRQFKGFRAGRYSDPVEPAAVAFGVPWDLRRLRPHFFPRAASVTFGRRAKVDDVTALPGLAEHWSGRLDPLNGSWADVSAGITRSIAEVEIGADESQSAYQKRFAQGATVVPRALFLVEDVPPDPLGVAAGTRIVRTRHSAYEKRPWKDIDRLEDVVEDVFVFPVYLGENVLPFRLLAPEECVVPWDGKRLMDGDSDRIDYYPLLARWWREAERIWLEQRTSNRLTLIERLDYRRGLSAQFPALSQRVVYSKAGMHLVAARVTDPTAVIDHTLYWGAAGSEEEALYLCAVLNSPVVTEQVRPLMAYGKDERHIDKAVWRLPIPHFDSADDRHRRLAELGAEAEKELGALAIDVKAHFPALRRKLRWHLAASPTGRDIDELVYGLLGDP